MSTIDWICSLQQQDPKLKLIIDVLLKLQQSSQLKPFEAEFCLHQTRLYKKLGDRKLLVVPKGIRWRIVHQCHDDVGHPGVDGTIRRLTENFWFPRIRNFVKGYVKACLNCCFHRVSNRSEAELYGADIPKLQFQVLHMDHLGPFVKSSRGYEYILVVVDALTRYVMIAALRSTKTKPVLDVLNQLTLYFGLPQKLITDRGTAFTSGVFKKYCDDQNIQHLPVAVRTPRANGFAERVNQEVLRYLKPTAQKEREWDRELRNLQWALNTKKNATTKMAPIDLIYDFPLRDLSGNKLLTALHDDTSIEMTSRREEAIKNITIAREKWKERFDFKYHKPTKYHEGDIVLIEAPAPATGHSRKLLPVYKGPYEVKKVLRFDQYIVETIKDLNKTNKQTI